ncbi:MAG: type II toxin-antitoxin system prevent-host-death family antitoxin [Candidatus Dormibacteraeota bacterium]|uniref:Antitoxin n=1 Tax=Candidatus Amunia macphersoniae TaxID=3127014 RepID=A0A934KL48_9BACT|nr:type II toxin-antitoxin system prevent-host-death family antitoxin [Candidatus Dormibacteraeota bacterium]
MRSVGSYEAKTHLPRLLDAVAGGETVTITKHGRPVARLVPFAGASSRDLTDVIAGMRKRSAGRTLGVAARDLIDEGRR